jgi:hypothetical protein
MISLGWDNSGTTVPTAFEGTNKGQLSSNLVTPARFERATCRLGGNCSIQLNYGASATAKDSKIGLLPVSHNRQRAWEMAARLANLSKSRRCQA